MLALNKDEITDDALKKMDILQTKENWNQQIYAKMSETTGLFFQWVTAVYSYAKAKLRARKDKDEMDIRTRRILASEKELHEIEKKVEQIKKETQEKIRIIENNKEKKEQLIKEQEEANESTKIDQETISAREGSQKTDSLKRFHSLERNSKALVKMIEDLPDENKSLNDEKTLPTIQSSAAQTMESYMPMDMQSMIADQVKKLCKAECQKFMQEYMRD